MIGRASQRSERGREALPEVWESLKVQEGLGGFPEVKEGSGALPVGQGGFRRHSRRSGQSLEALTEVQEGSGGLLGG